MATHCIAAPNGADKESQADEPPFSDEGLDALTAYALLMAGHIKTLRYITAEFELAGDRHAEFKRAHEILEFITLEIGDAAAKAEQLARGWGKGPTAACAFGMRPRPCRSSRAG